MNSYSTSTGERFTSKRIDELIRQAKAFKLLIQVDISDYNFCEQCGKNGQNTRLDCSHDISVKKCKDEGRAELAWAVSNITILCRECHQKKDGLNLKFNGKNS